MVTATFGEKRTRMRSSRETKVCTPVFVHVVADRVEKEREHCRVHSLRNRDEA